MKKDSLIFIVQKNSIYWYTEDGNYVQRFSEEAYNMQ